MTRASPRRGWKRLPVFKTLAMMTPDTFKKDRETVMLWKIVGRSPMVIAVLLTLSAFVSFGLFGSSDIGVLDTWDIGIDRIPGDEEIVSEKLRRRNYKRSVTDSCWAKSELKEYGYLTRIPSSLAFRKRATEYAKHHGSCMAALKNFTAAFLGEELVSYNIQNGTRVPCQFAILHGSSQGLGNRLQAMVAAYGYSLLTNRVYVIMDWVSKTLVCEPFTKQGWYIPWTMVQFVLQNSLIRPDDLVLSEKEWSQKLQESGSKGKFSSGLVDIHYENSVAVQSFFCESVQERVKSITHFVLSTEQYFLPGLFLVPSFRSQLEAWFPDLLPFTHLSRILLVPSNIAWERITRMYAMHFLTSSRKIGIQVRTFHRQDEFAHAKILDCLVNVSKALPRPMRNQAWRDMITSNEGPNSVRKALKKITVDPSAEKVMVYVTSLHEHHASFLRDAYYDGVAWDGSMVNVHSYTSLGEEKHSFVLDSRAFTEIWLVAMCDSIFSSYFSTFGYVASGLSGHTPYLLNVIPKGGDTFGPPFDVNGRPVCERSVSSEPCYHSEPENRTCVFGGGAKARAGNRKSVPLYLQPCQDAWSGYRIDPGLKQG